MEKCVFQAFIPDCVWVLPRPKSSSDLNPTENVCQTANQSRTGDREYVTTQVYSAYNPVMTGIM